MRRRRPSAGRGDLVARGRADGAIAGVEVAAVGAAVR